MIQFEPNTLYPMDELREALRGIVELPTFLDRLGLRDRRVFKGGLWGWEVLEAARKAESFSETADNQAAAAVVQLMERGKGKGRRPSPGNNPTGRLSVRDLRD